MAEADAKSSFMSVYQELLGSTSYVSEWAEAQSQWNQS
jgi:hypothetical protein